MTRLLVSTLFMIGCLIAFGQTKEKDSGKDKQDVGTVIGIDLGKFFVFVFSKKIIIIMTKWIFIGTTYSCVGVFKNGRVEIIPNDQGNRITPSYVAFTAEGERLIGDAAKNQLTSNPENTVFDVKRLIGREWGDSTVQSDIKFFPFKGNYSLISKSFQFSLFFSNSD